MPGLQLLAVVEVFKFWFWTAKALWMDDLQVRTCANQRMWHPLELSLTVFIIIRGGRA